MHELPNAKFRVINEDYQRGVDPHFLGRRTDDRYMDYKELQEEIKKESAKWLKRWKAKMQNAREVKE